jgi:hypothetical protein
VEKLLAQAEYAIWVEKRNCAQQVSQMSPTESQNNYGNSQGGRDSSNQPLPNSLTSAPFPSSANSANPATQSHSHGSSHGGNSNGSGCSGVGLGNNSISRESGNCGNGLQQPRPHYAKKSGKTLEEESVV